MARLYVLIKRKGSSKWLGAIPARKNTTKAQLRSSVSSSIRKGFSYSIVTASELKKVIMRQARGSKNKTTKKVIKRKSKPSRKKSVKRRTVRRKTVRRRIKKRRK